MPLVALLPALIGAGGTVAGSLLGRHSGPSSSTLLPPGLDTNALMHAITGTQALGNKIAGEGFDTFGKGANTLTGPLSFYNSLLTGDRTSMMQTLAPEIGAINEQFNEPLREGALFGRGTGLLPDLDAQRQAAISGLFFKERPMAADKLSGIAQQLMSLGTQQQGAGADILGRSTGQILDYNSIIRGIQARGSEANSQMWGQLGAQLGPILGGVLGGIFDKKGGGGVALPQPGVGTPSGAPSIPPIVF